MPNAFAASKTKAPCAISLLMFYIKTHKRLQYERFLFRQEKQCAGFRHVLPLTRHVDRQVHNKKTVKNGQTDIQENGEHL